MLEGLLWIAHQYGASGYCVTWVRGLDEPELLRRFGGDPSHAWPISFADISALQKVADYDWLGPDLALNEELLDDEPIIQVGRCADWAFVIERYNTFEGTRPEVLCVVSAGTVAVSVFCNVNAMTIFGYAQDGVAEVCSDPVWPPPPGRVDLGLLEALLRQAGIDPQIDENDDCQATMFALAEAIGVRLDREAVAERPLLSGIILDPPYYRTP